MAFFFFFFFFFEPIWPPKNPAVKRTWKIEISKKNTRDRHRYELMRGLYTARPIDMIFCPTILTKLICTPLDPLTSL